MIKDYVVLLCPCRLSQAFTTNLSQFFIECTIVYIPLITDHCDVTLTFVKLSVSWFAPKANNYVLLDNSEKYFSLIALKLSKIDWAVTG